MNIRHQGHTDATPVQLSFDVPQILCLVQRGRRDAHDFAASLDELDRFRHRSGSVHRIANGHGLDADWVVATEWHVPNGHDTGLAATVSKGIMTVCRQRDHGDPFATCESGQDMTDATLVVPNSRAFCKTRM